LTALPVSAKETEIVETCADYNVEVGDTIYIFLKSNNPVHWAGWTSDAPFDVEIINQDEVHCEVKINKYVSGTVYIRCDYYYYAELPYGGMTMAPGFKAWSIKVEKTYVTIKYSTGTYETLPSDTILSGSAIGNLPEPTRYNYEFVGWYLTPDYSERVWESTTFNRNTTVYAKWKYAPQVVETVAPKPTEAPIKPPETVATETVVNPNEHTFDNGKFGTYRYIVNDYGIAKITGYTQGTERSIEIPSIIDGYRVGYIGNSAFQGKNQLEKVEISKGIIGIEDYAFFYCKKLKEVSLPEGMTSIGEKAFNECSSLESVYIPESMTDFGTDVFSACHENFTIYSYMYKPAHNFANRHNYKFTAVKKHTDYNSGISIVPVINNQSPFSVTEISDSEIFEDVAETLDEGTVNKIYDVSMNQNELPFDLTVYIPTDEADARVYRAESDGSLSEIKSTYDNGTQVFTTESLGRFVLVSDVVVKEPTDILTEPTEVTTETTSVSTVVPGRKILGDANLDTKVNVKDATAIQKHIALIQELSADGMLCADCNGDIVVNIKDATWIQKFVAKVDCPYDLGLEIQTSDSTTTQATVHTTEPQTTTVAPTTVTEPTEQTTESEPATTVIPYNPTKPDTNITIYFSNNVNWSTVNAYFYNDEKGTELKSWPGTPMTLETVNDFGEQIYKINVDVSQYNRVVFNNGQSQTLNAAVTVASSGFFITSQTPKSAMQLGAYSYGSTDYGTKTTVNLDYPTGYKKPVEIWTPAGYDPADTSKKYSVIYLLDGQNQFDDSDAYNGGWGSDEVITALMKNGGDGIILVGIDNSRNRDNELTPDIGDVIPVYNSGGFKNGSGAQFAGFVAKTVVPYIESNYNVYTDAEHSAIVGSSSGGIEAFYIGMEYMDQFSRIGAISPAFMLYDKSTWFEYFEKYDFANAQNLPRIYFFNGGGDSLEQELLPYARDMKTWLTSLGYDADKMTFVYDEKCSHNEAAWRSYMPEIVSWLFELQ